VAQKLSRALDEFRTPSPVARAVAQLQAAGKSTSPGERVRFVYTRGEPGVHAWNLPGPVDPRSVDCERYAELLLRGAASILTPFGVSEDLLRQWLFGNAAYAAPPGQLAEKRAELPLLERGNGRGEVSSAKERELARRAQGKY
jgi:DNA polymerase elongation subunit (family B)